MPDDGTAISSIQEVRAGRPWWQVCCAGCLLLVAAVFVGGWLLFRGGPGPTNVHLTTLPDAFPKDIQLYHVEDADSITLIQGKNTNKFLQAIMTPLHLFTSGAVVTTTPSLIGSTSTATIQTAMQVLDTYAEKFKDMDTVIVSWDHVSSTRQEIMDFYQGSFARGGFASTSSRDAITGTEMVIGTRPDASIQLQLEEDEQGRGIDAMVAAVTYSLKP